MNQSAYVLRENTGTTGVLATAQAKRLRDKADVTELIFRRKLPRELVVAAPVRGAYVEVWDALQAEG
jgi:hypothetical protein